ncbi:hypothetical protein E2C01_069754 [Portunus trituberculatus]|uniref:Uncharacterized protein n=1 Tax=Portunus trituberculatus TaxID=210409 RepID=A0A5B7I368_PORTR|nr:hypothetical protein [Portunus trituberculatus]
MPGCQHANSDRLRTLLTTLTLSTAKTSVSHSREKGQLATTLTLFGSAGLRCSLLAALTLSY